MGSSPRLYATSGDIETEAALSAQTTVGRTWNPQRATHHLSNICFASHNSALLLTILLLFLLPTHFQSPELHHVIETQDSAMWSLRVEAWKLAKLISTIILLFFYWSFLQSKVLLVPYLPRLFLLSLSLSQLQALHIISSLQVQLFVRKFPYKLPVSDQKIFLHYYLTKITEVCI